MSIYSCLARPGVTVEDSNELGRGGLVRWMTNQRPVSLSPADLKAATVVEGLWALQSAILKTTLWMETRY